MKSRLRARVRGLVARFKRNQRASVAIEFGLLALPFALLMFAILETCVSFTAQLLMSNATDDLARQIKTGQLRSPTEAQLKTAICGQLQIMVSEGCPGLQVDLRQIQSFVEGTQHTFKIEGSGEKQVNLYQGSTPRAFTQNAGGASTTNMLRIFYRWPIMTDVMRGKITNFGDASTLLYSAAVWRNEAF